MFRIRSTRVAVLFRLLCGISVLVIFLFSLHFLPTIMYIHNTYLRSVNWNNSSEHNVIVNRIPKIIHQVYFEKDPNHTQFFDRYNGARQSWRKLNPDFKYILWNRSMVDTFLEANYPETFKLYKSYPSWNTQHDVSRYVIVYHFGGIYADIDTRCTGNISQLLSTAFRNKRQVILHIGKFNVATTDLFAATPKHLLFLHVLSGLSEAKRSYIFPYWDTMLSAGPTYFHGQYRNFKSKGQIMTLSFVNEYFVHFSALSWQKWDGKFLTWVQKKKNYNFIIIILICFAVVNLIYKIYMRMKHMMFQGGKTTG